MRTASINRDTMETQIRLSLELDGTGKAELDTGCGFLNHMLTLFARHGDFDLSVCCRGDTDSFIVAFYIRYSARCNTINDPVKCYIWYFCIHDLLDRRLHCVINWLNNNRDIFLTF